MSSLFYFCHSICQIYSETYRKIVMHLSSSECLSLLKRMPILYFCICYVPIHSQKKYARSNNDIDVIDKRVNIDTITQNVKESRLDEICEGSIDSDSHVNLKNSENLSNSYNIIGISTKSHSDESQFRQRL